MAEPRPGHVHEAGVYASDGQFRELIAGFVEEGMAAGEPVVLGYDERKSRLLRSWIGEPAGVTFMGGADQYATPAGALLAWRRQVERHVAVGATRVRIAGDVPHPGTGHRYQGWDRYEWAINTVWRDLPAHIRCLYDGTITPPGVLDVVERTHPFLLTSSGKPSGNPRYGGTAAFEALPPDPEPFEGAEPLAELVDPSPAQARRALAQFARDRLDASTLGDLVLAGSETVANAHRHGRPPVTVRVWGVEGRVVVAVHDAGAGPTDPLAGLVPATNGSEAGLGLWVCHQLPLEIDLVRSEAGFTVRLCARTAGPPPAGGQASGTFCPL